MNMTMKTQNWLQFSKKFANVYYMFKKYVHQTFNDKNLVLLVTSLCLSLVSVMKFVLSKHIY